MDRRDLLERYFASVVEEGVHPRPANLKFYLDFLFHSVPLAGKSVLDIGGGDGIFSLYACCAGASGVVCLEPEAAGSRPGMSATFGRMAARLGVAQVRYEPTTFQAFDPRGEAFDVILLHNSINHLDEEACIALQYEPEARARYNAIFRKMARLSRNGATLIITDCSRHNFFALIHARNPIMPLIEWHKHQSPGYWARLLSEAGFARPRIRWRSPSSLRSVGRILLGNPLASLFLDSQFRLTMIRTRDAPG